ncbi:uncharacterized protein MONOS_17234 [Monocercomonoides exilis]|uniref:uncharacterized protein n=1 Tax=Monocercomonoides exilis TaxID=2049356 RepID=UPI00355A6D83|nr:hypothetical protein MONOS_17234 [Monocercomonoides exilis]
MRNFEFISTHLSFDGDFHLIMDFETNTEIIRAIQKQSDKTEQATIKMFYQIEMLFILHSIKVNCWEEMIKDRLYKSKR